MMRLRRHVGLIILLSAFFALGWLYLRTTPLLETPDEASHFSVVKYMADEVRIPPQQPPPAEPEPVPIVREGPPVYYAPPLYHALGAILIVDLNTEGFAQGVVPNPNWGRGWSPMPGRSPENKHMYVHTADQRSPYAGWAQAMYRLRVFSLLLGSATVAGTYVLARILWPDRADHGWVLGATALVAFNPVFLFSTTGISNDALLITLITWAFVIMARMVGLGVKPSRLKGWVWVTLLGIAVGLAVLTKQSGLVFVPAAGLAVIWSASTQPRPKRTVLIWLLLFAVLAATICGWWYAHNTLSYGDPLGMKPHQLPAGSARPSPSQAIRELGQVLQGYWGVFGWGLILVDPVIYIVIAAFVGVGLLGLLRRRAAPTPLEPQTREWQQRKQVEQRIVVMLVLGLFLNLIGLMAWLLSTSVPYGSRLVFPTVALLAVLLVMGWRRWLGPRRAQWFAWAVALAFGTYAVIVPWRYLQPAYASPVVTPSAAAEATPLDGRFCAHEPSQGPSSSTSEANGCIRLLGYRVTPETATPGDKVTLTLYWQAMAPIGDDLTVFVHIAPRDPQQRVAGLDDFLGSPRYPSGVWRENELVQQIHQFRLSKDVPTPALYWYSVGLYDESGGERLAVIVDDVLIPDRVVRLGPLKLRGQNVEEPRQQVDYRFGSAIRLTGYDVAVGPENAGGEAASSLAVTLYWQADAAPEKDWVVFIHLLDADGQLVAQHDGVPRGGDYPTWAWIPGDRVIDTHELFIPSDPKAGTHHIQVGLYHATDGVRAPISDSARQFMPNGVLPLADIALDGGDVRGGE